MELRREDIRMNNLMDKIKKSFSNRKFKSGAYVSLVSAIVIVIIFVINLIVSDLDLRVDFTSSYLYTLTEETKELLADLEEDVTIYYLVESGYESPVFKGIAEEFESYSNNISLEQKDPVLYPQFAYQYIDPDTEVNRNSFLIVNNNNDRAKYIDNNDLMIKEFNYNTFSFLTTGIDMEGQVVSAIQYVIEPDLPVIYRTVGHNEFEIGSLFKGYMDKQNISLKDLETLKVETIPEDCDVLLINVPHTDFTDNEINMIKEYMASGGDVLVISDYTSRDLRNFQSLLEYYGLKFHDGIIIEGNSNMHMPNSPFSIIPGMVQHDITDKMIDKGRFTLMELATGITELDAIRSSLEISPLLVTSEESYVKTDVDPEMLDKEEGDIDGPFYTGVLVTETFEGVTSNMVVYTSRTIFTDNFLNFYGNEDILGGTFAFLTDKVSEITIPSKNILPKYAYVTQQQAIFWGALAIAVLPVLFLATGAFVGIRRRRG